MNIARTVLAAAALVGAAGSANAATSIVQNGSFEIGRDPVTNIQLDAGTPSATDITGWTVTQNSVDYIRFLWQASNGERSVDLAGAAPGVLSQLLTGLVSGQLYSVTFDVSKNPDGGSVPRFGTSTVTDSSGGTPVILGTRALSSSVDNSRLDMMWQSVSYSFVALSQQALLSFAADGPSSTSPGGSDPAFGLAIDNVGVFAVDNIAAVPEPATWALMILGFGMVGSALRRRRRTQVRFNFA